MKLSNKSTKKGKKIYRNKISIRINKNLEKSINIKSRIRKYNYA